MIHPRHKILDPFYLTDVLQRHTRRKNIRSRVHERRLQHIYRPFLFHIRVSLLRDAPTFTRKQDRARLLLTARTFALTEGQGCLPCTQIRYHQYGPRLLEYGRIRIPGMPPC